MKLIDFRFVLRNGEKVLQVRHYTVTRSEFNKLGSWDVFSEWTAWEDVPTVEEDGE